MKYWIITDTHFSHKALHEYCGRPENVDSIIKDNIIKRVRNGDTLIHLGDVCIGNDKENNEWFSRLDGVKRVLVKGNHDHKSNQWYMDHGWTLACERFDIDMYGKKIAFTHAPIALDGYFDLNIHGHFHNTDHRRTDPKFNGILSGYNKLIALEYTGYAPLSLEGLTNKTY